MKQISDKMQYLAIVLLILAILPDISCSSRLFNQTPVISSLTAVEETVNPSDSSHISCVARDPDNDDLTYTWSADGGTISGEGANVTWMASEKSGVFTITVNVSDGKSATATKEVTVDVLSKDNFAPFIQKITRMPDKSEIYDDEKVTLTCIAKDLEGDEITYIWEVTGGSISGSGSTVVWTPPKVEDAYQENTVTVRVMDSKGSRSARQFMNFNVACDCLRNL
jgi:hypothetical protein